jgi:hypothetical protein
VRREGLCASTDVIGVGSVVNDPGCSPCKPSQTCFLQPVQRHYRGLLQVTEAVQNLSEAYGLLKAVNVISTLRDTIIVANALDNLTYVCGVKRQTGLDVEPKSAVKAEDPAVLPTISGRLIQTPHRNITLRAVSCLIIRHPTHDPSSECTG